MTDPGSEPVYQVGQFIFAPGDHRLSLNGDEIHLRPKAYTLLELAYELEAARPWDGERPPIWSGAAA